MGGRGGGSPAAADRQGAAYAVGRNADQQAVINAYAQLRPEINEWVRLSQLRPALEALGWDRDRQDRVLRGMVSRSDTHIITIANLKSLTPADRAAALHIGDQDATAIGMDTKATIRRARSERAAARKRASSPQSQARRQAQIDMVQREAREAAEAAARRR